MADLHHFIVNKAMTLKSGCRCEFVILRVRLGNMRNETLTPSAQRIRSASNVSLDDIREIAEAFAQDLEDDKAEDILFIELEGKSSLADFMIIASGRSGRHVSALSDHLMKRAKELTGKPASVEGMPNADWVLIDTGDIIVHLFRAEVREFYNLEKIWAPDDSRHLSN